MNRRPSGLKLSKALVGFLHYKAAEGLSPTTLTNYEAHLKLWISHGGDLEIDGVTTQDLRAYLAWLRAEYQPHRLTGNQHPLSPKTIRNNWITLFLLHLGKQGIRPAQSDEDGPYPSLRESAC